MSKAFPIIYTIGYSNHNWERFAELLAPYEIDLLVDVRSYPRSRFAPWSNRDRIECNLTRIGVEYLWKGYSLGGMPRAPNRSMDSETMSVGGWYEQRAREPDFEAGIIEASRLARGKRLAVMCSEGGCVAMPSIAAPSTEIHTPRLRTPAHQPEGLRSFCPVVDGVKRLRARRTNGALGRAVLDSVNMQRGSYLANGLRTPSDALIVELAL